MSEENNRYNLSQFSEETRQLLATGMSVMAAQESMGLATDANAEIRRREAAELAADMERKNRENQLRRAASVTGGTAAAPATADQKPKLKGRRKKGIPKQEPSKIRPVSNIPEPPPVQQPSVQPATVPPGLTEADMMLIEQVKASRNRAMDTYLESHDTVHPRAYDARPAQEVRTQEPSQWRPAKEPAPQFTQPQVQQPPVPQPIQPIPSATLGSVQPQYVLESNQPQYMQTPYQPSYGWQQAPQPTQAPQPPQPPQPIQQPAVPFNAYDSGPKDWDDEVDPDMPEDTQEDTGSDREELAEEAVPAREPSIVHAVTPAPFDPGVPDRDFAAFSEVSGFPTQGIFYPDKIFGQGLTTVDADMLSAMDPDDPMEVANTFTAILGRRIRGINPEDILSADEEFIVYWLRESTYLTESLPKPKFICEHCNARIVKPEDLGSIGRLGFADQEFITENDPAEVAAKHAAEGFVRYTMFDGRECAIYLRRRKHDRAIAEYMDGWEKANQKIYPVYRAFNTSIAAFVEIEDCETMSEKIRFLEEYPLSKRQELLKAIYDAQVVSKTFVRIKCPKCGGVARVPYSFQSTSFVASLR